MDKRKKVQSQWKTYKAGLGACGLVSCLCVPPLNRPVVRAESDDEAADRDRVYRNTLAGEGWYRRESRAKR